MDYFDRTKRSMLEKLYKPDRSFKGTVDTKAIPIINEFNKKENYYTTSSCSGRISLFFEADSGRKDESGWLLVKHRIVDEKEIFDALKKIPKETVWFRQEPPIFHVACKANEDAKKLLEICRDLGLKHSGIIGNSRRFIVQIMFNDKIDVPITAGGVLFAENKFIKFLIKKANSKFKKSEKLLNKFHKSIQKKL